MTPLKIVGLVLSLLILIPWILLVDSHYQKGGVMLMKPLTLHASKRTTNGKRRRVIHLEFNRHPLSTPLEWLEFLIIN